MATILSLTQSLPHSFPKIINIPITEAKITCTVTSVKNKNSSGYHGLPNNILKICGEYIGRPLAYIFDTSLTLGICLDCFKYSTIKPLFKKGERPPIFNYRLISILNGF